MHACKHIKAYGVIYKLMKITYTFEITNMQYRSKHIQMLKHPVTFMDIFGVMEIVDYTQSLWWHGAHWLKCESL